MSRKDNLEYVKYTDEQLEEMRIEILKLYERAIEDIKICLGNDEKKN